MLRYRGRKAIDSCPTDGNYHGPTAVYYYWEDSTDTMYMMPFSEMHRYDLVAMVDEAGYTITLERWEALNKDSQIDSAL